MIFSYLIGSIPCGLALGKCCGIDVRAAGSGNIGATNVSRLLGRKLGIITLLGDAAKGYGPMLLASRILAAPAGHWVLWCGAAAFLGHLFPVYLGFKGGKGVATALGIFLFLNPLAVALLIPLFMAVVWIWGYVSLGSLVAAAAMPLLLHLLHGSGPQLILSLAIAALICLKHRANIGRLLRHEEKSWKKKE